mmetsp:Transcript_3310/g.6790  ORF Transcript_3310/g.6790 Transcript_3310/m.6790 type:complete len:97 (-) Transcript_3310:51-341(-)
MPPPCFSVPLVSDEPSDSWVTVFVFLDGACLKPKPPCRLPSDDKEQTGSQDRGMGRHEAAGESLSFGILVSKWKPPAGHTRAASVAKHKVDRTAET